MDLSAEEQREQLEGLRLLQNLHRTPTFKRVTAVLTERREQLLADLGQVGFTDTDRAMLHGRLAMLTELLLHLGRIIVDKELADRSPLPEPDDPEGSLLDPARMPEMF